MQPGRDSVVLGFVDFVSPAHAATAMDALQGVLASALIINLIALFLWLLNFAQFCLLTDITIGQVCALNFHIYFRLSSKKKLSICLSLV